MIATTSAKNELPATLIIPSNVGAQPPVVSVGWSDLLEDFFDFMRKPNHEPTIANTTFDVILKSGILPIRSSSECNNQTRLPKIPTLKP
jgi:hypothetical protein